MRGAALVLAVAVCARIAGADGGETGGMAGPLERAGLSGWVAADYWSSDHDLDDRLSFPGINLDLQQRLSLAEGVRWVAEARVLAEQLGRWYTIRRHGTVRSLKYADQVTAELREGYVEVAREHWELRAGRQIIVWGRADEINPTDVVTPKDYLLLRPEGQPDYRFGANALRLDTFLPASLRLTGVWVPVFSPSVIPLGPTPPGVRLTDQFPGIGIEDGSAGVKLDRSGGAVDASLSYFYGYDLLPEIRVLRAGVDPHTRAPHVDSILRYGRRHMVGGDFATTRGGWGFRGEAAYVSTDNPEGRRVGGITPYAFYVFGVERTLPAETSLILQYVGRHVFHRVDPARALADPNPLRGQARFAAARETFTIQQQLDTWQNGMSIRLAKHFWNDTLELELLGVQFFERNDFFLRPKIAYDVTDAVQASVGAEVFGGPRRSLFGRLKDNTGAFTEVKYGF